MPKQQQRGIFLTALLWLTVTDSSKTQLARFFHMQILQVPILQTAFLGRLCCLPGPQWRRLCIQRLSADAHIKAARNRIWQPGMPSTDSHWPVLLRQPLLSRGPFSRCRGRKCFVVFWLRFYFTIKSIRMALHIGVVLCKFWSALLSANI